MNDNAYFNKRFLDSINSKTRNMILENIANHYGISKNEAYTEITTIDAEHLLEYITGRMRLATSLLMRQTNFFPKILVVIKPTPALVKI